MSETISYNRLLVRKDHMSNFMSGFNRKTEKCVFIKRCMASMSNGIFKSINNVHFQCCKSWKLESTRP